MRSEDIGALAGVVSAVIGVIGLAYLVGAQPQPTEESEVVREPPPVTREPPSNPVAEPVQRVSWSIDTSNGGCRVRVSSRSSVDRESAEYQNALAEGRAACASRLPEYRIFPDRAAGRCRTQIRGDLTGYERERARENAQAACDRAMGFY
jgi:hypothetical protein